MIRDIMLTGMVVVFSVPVHAAETVSYQYDAKGRLVSIIRSGSVNNGIMTTYEHEKADNRKRVVVTGATR